MNLQPLKQYIIEQIQNCADGDLLDLIFKLLMTQR